MRGTALLRRLFVATLLVGSTVGQAQDRRGPVILRGFVQPSVVISGPDSISSLLRLPVRPSTRSTATWRGGIDVYKAVAPAVVVVRTETGHGSGFLIDPNGLLVTNHHVIATGLQHDPARNASYATVHLGDLAADGTMHLRSDSVRAYVYKDDPVRDLALLRIAGSASTPFLRLSDAAPRPGQDCAVIGHPSSGMLWTMRPGEVSAIGNLPADLVNVVMLKLAATRITRQQLVDELQRQPARRILITSVEANPGDSGGPLVDDMSRVIGVTFGGPGDVAESKFTYHVHLDELKAVLASVPQQPMLVIPDPWDLGPQVELQDLDNDGTPDVLLAGADKPETMLFDLDNGTPPELTKPAALNELIRTRKWHWEFGLHTGEGEVATFYDTDNDGEVDLVLTAPDGSSTADGRFVRTASGWQYEAGSKLPLFNAKYFKDPALVKRATQVMTALTSRH